MCVYSLILLLAQKVFTRRSGLKTQISDASKGYQQERGRKDWSKRESEKVKKQSLNSL